MAQKDTVLVGVLERLADEMTRLEVMVAELHTRQIELAEVVEKSSLLLRGKQDDAQRSYDKLYDALKNFRSDMLSLVNEQDRINQNINNLQAELKTTLLTVDVTSKKLIEMENRIERYEEKASVYYEHAYKQPDVLKDAINTTSRDFTMLHAQTEKRFSELQNEITARLQNFEHETARRLLLLDNITTDLQVLIARTEPPEKKPFWIRSLAIKVRGIFRRKLHKRRNQSNVSQDSRDTV